MEKKVESEALKVHPVEVPPPADVIEVKDDDNLSNEEFYQKHGVAKPPAAGYGKGAPSATVGGAQSAVASLVNRLSKPAEKKILSVETSPTKALVALVTQMTFGAADKAELLITE